MKQEEVDQAMSVVSQFGERTKAMLILELQHDGKVRMSVAGLLPDINWMSTALENFIKDAMNAARKEGTIIPKDATVRSNEYKIT